MRHQNCITFILVLFCYISYGQTKNSIFFDTTICDENRLLLNLNDKKVLKALTDASNYIQTIVGKKNLDNHIRLHYCASRESGFQIYGDDIKHPQRIGEDTCYEFHYFVVDNIDTLGDFQLVIGRQGQLIKDQTYEDFSSHPELIRGFKKALDKSLKIGYRQSIKIANQNGFKSKPILTSETDNYFSSVDNKTFVKVKYYWSFSEIPDRGAYATLKINAETGKVESKQIIPPMPK